MEELQRQILLAQAKDFFRNRIAANHMRNAQKLKTLYQFHINPFSH